MGHANTAEAKAHLSDRIARAEAAETISIGRRGRPVAEHRAIEQPSQPIDVAAPRAFIAGLPESPAGTVETPRDQARF
jgi:antitoxin (DNA-binding transcriptional repressor) of toxin-antitoxin stability system